MTPDKNNPLTGPFWQAAEKGSLSLCWCVHCNQAVWYPASACPECSHNTSWKSLSGRATLLSWSVVRVPLNPAFESPYITALVLPEEAPHARLVTQLVDCTPEDLRCDMPLRVQFRELKTRSGVAYMAPLFGPANYHL